MTRLLFLATCVASALSSVNAAVGTGDGTSAQSNGGAPSSSEQCSGPDCAGVKPGGAPPASMMSGAMPPAEMMGSKESGCMLMKMSMDGSMPMQEVAKPAMAMGKMWNVEVGGAAGLVYTPPTINAAVGDMITFSFLAKNHSLTQSTFPKPCIKAKDPPGLDTGFMPNPDGKSPPPMVMYQVMTDKPQWFYCRQKGHCGMGMAFSINPTADKTQAQFVSMAKMQNGTNMLAPPPSGGSMSMGSSMGSMGTSMTMMTTTTAAASMTTTSMNSMMMMSASMTTASITAISQISDGQIQAPPAGGAPAPAAPAAPASPPPPPPASPAAPAGANTGMMAAGTGSGSGETCSCTCMCGVGAFPAADQGMGMYGGMSGAVPAGGMAPAAYKFKA